MIFTASRPFVCVCFLFVYRLGFTILVVNNNETGLSIYYYYMNFTFYWGMTRRARSLAGRLSINA